MAPRRKTRDRILAASLLLFNEEGEANISTVDVANAIEISPGNLYYHFHGKDEIIEALFDAFEVEIKQVLRAPIKKPLELEDNWIFLYIIFEEIYDFRFFYQNLADLLHRYDGLSKRFARLLKLKSETLAALLKGLMKQGFIELSASELALFAERATMHVTYWLTYQSLYAPGASEREIIHRGVYQLVLQIIPYVASGREDFHSLIAAYYEQATAN